MVATGSGLAFCETKTGNQLSAVAMRKGEKVESLAASPVDQLYATGLSVGRYDAPGKVALWDEMGKIVVEFGGPSGQVEAVAFSPDGKILATANRKHFNQWNAVPEFFLWDVVAHDLVSKHTLGDGGGRGSCRAEVSQVTFSPDGETLAIALLQPASVVLWNIGQGIEVNSVAGFRNDGCWPYGALKNAYSVGFSPDGSEIAVAGTGSMTPVVERDYREEKSVQFWQVVENEGTPQSAVSVRR